MNLDISISILGADFSRLDQEIRSMEEAGADSVHFDIMDGHFVPNLTFGPMLIKALRPSTRLPFIAHLMVDDPDRYIDLCIESGASTILVHPESVIHLHRSLQHIRQKGARAGVAVNPSTSLSFLPYCAEVIDDILIMTVNPGFASQALIKPVIAKIGEARKLTEEHRINAGIGVDGGVNEDTLAQVTAQGAGTVIMATAFFKAPDRRQFISDMRKKAQ